MSVWKEYLQSLARDRLKMKRSLAYQDDADITWVYTVVSDSKLKNCLKLESWLGQLPISKASTVWSKLVGQGYYMPVSKEFIQTSRCPPTCGRQSAFQKTFMKKGGQRNWWRCSGIPWISNLSSRMGEKVGGSSMESVTTEKGVSPMRSTGRGTWRGRGVQALSGIQCLGGDMEQSVMEWECEEYEE